MQIRSTCLMAEEIGEIVNEETVTERCHTNQYEYAS